MRERASPYRFAASGSGRPLRILMTTDTAGGVFTYAVDLCRELGHHDVEVVLVTMGAPLTDAQNAVLLALPRVKICESCYRLEWMHAPWREVDAAGEWLMELEALYQPDVIHLNGYAHGALPWDAPVLVVGHSCVLSWWRAVKGEDAPREWDTYRQRVAAGMAAADLVVAPTRAMLDALERLYGPLASKRVIYNGRMSRAFRADTPKRPLVFSAGRLWDEAKNLAALEACHGCLPWPVYVAGPTRPPEGAPRIGHGGVRTLGPLTPDVLAAWLARAAVYALPARYEPFGLSALEAALSGCALVLGDIDSLREIWDGAAVFVPPDDSEALGRAICELAEQGQWRMRMAEAAHARALGYTSEHMAHAYLAAYEELVRDREASHGEAGAGTCAGSPGSGYRQGGSAYANPVACAVNNPVHM